MSVANFKTFEAEENLPGLLRSKISTERENAWEYIYKTYYPMVRDYVMRNNGSETDSTDVFQDGMMILYRNFNNGTFREESTIGTYIFSICRNLWLKETSLRQKKHTLDVDTLNNVSLENNYFINTEIITLLMNELKEDCRNILTEYYFNKRSMAELKEIFHVNSIQAAKNKKWRCMTYLIKLFKEKSITPEWN